MYATKLLLSLRVCKCILCDAVARRNGLKPFSIYQGRWNAVFRDMEAELVPMCEDQGMAIISWAALGGGQLLTSEQRARKERDPGARKARGGSESDEKVCKILEVIAKQKSTSLQAIVCSLCPSDRTLYWIVADSSTTRC